MTVQRTDDGRQMTDSCLVPKIEDRGRVTAFCPISAFHLPYSVFRLLSSVL